MSRQKRNQTPGFSYHITTRCNNRELISARRECREVFLYAIKKGSDKYGFKLYALCIMSNHVHYVIEPATPEDLPKIMHFRQLVHSHVLQPDAQSYRALLGGKILL